MRDIAKRNFDYIKAPKKLLMSKIVQMIASITERNGKKELLLEVTLI